MSRFVLVLLAAAVLGGCAPTMLSVRAPLSPCTNTCFSGSYDREAQAECLKRCPGAHASEEACPPPLTDDQECVEVATPECEADDDARTADFIVDLLFLFLDKR